MARHTMEMPRSIRVVRQSMSPEIEETVLHALEKSPVDRFKTMDDFKRALLGQGGTVTAWRVTRTVASEAEQIAAPYCVSSPMLRVSAPSRASWR
jgi:hypothetical protein